MIEQDAIAAFGALAQEHRLRIVRRLVKAGPEGLSAGALAEAAGISPSNLSFHVSHLEQSGLVKGRRESRSMIYSVVFPALSNLVDFLVTDCCRGRPEVCWPDSAATCKPKGKTHVR